jgi:hypothetical protein
LPTWSVASVIQTDFTDSLSFNPVTDIVFIASDFNSDQIVLAPPGLPLSAQAFESDFGYTDGNAFDPFTNILSLSPEVSLDQSWAFNFATLAGGTANNVVVPDVCPGGGTGCLGELAPLGEGPGGQVAINCSTHQSVVVDEYGQNLKLVHLPPLPVPVGTPLNNNNRPGVPPGPHPEASVYTIATTVIPKGNVNGTPTVLGALGDPNSLTIDPAHNFAYMLGDNIYYYHQWGGGTNTPLFLIRVDLSNPTVGGGPLGGIGSTFWNLTAPSVAIPMPPGP